MNLLELVLPKVKLVGFHVGFRCGFGDHTRGTQRVDGGEPNQGEHTGRQNVATSQSRFSPKTSKWHNFAFTKCKGKLGSLNPFKSRICFFTCCFFCCSLPPTKCPFRFQVSFRVPGVWYAKKHQSRFNPSMVGKTFTKCH